MTEENQNLGFFKKSKNSGAIYFHIFDGSLCQKSSVELDGWEGPIQTQHPITKAYKNTWVIRFDSIAAYIIDANRFKKEFSPEQGGGKTSGLTLTLAAGTMKGVLQLVWNQTGPEPVFKRFLKVAPNIDFEKPILISAWKNAEKKQAVSFKQGDDPDPQKWAKVEEYWKRPVDPDSKKPLPGTQAVGADGSILPDPDHDEFNDRWNYDAQNKFLMIYFMEKIEPKIKAIASKYESTNPVPEDEGFPAYSGEQEPIAVVTTRPADPTGKTIADMATGNQRAEIKKLSVAANFDFEANCERVLGCKFDDLSKEAASFAIYKLETIIANESTQPQAQAAAAPAQATQAPAPPAPAQQVAAPVVTDDWEAAPAPAATTPTASSEVPWD